MRRNIILIVVGGLVVSLLFYFVLITPKIKDISAVKDKIEEAQRRERTLRNSLRQLQEADRNKAATQAKLAKLELALPQTPDLPAFIRQVQAASNAAGIDLRSIAPSPPSAMEGSTGIEQITVTLQVSGGYFRMQDFLARLEDLQRVVEVRSVSLAPGTDEITGEFSLQGTITMAMYVVQTGARAAAVRPTTPRGTASPTATASPSPSPTGAAS
jgi:Tfp pilus assembly protein PilO